MDASNFDALQEALHEIFDNYPSFAGWEDWGDQDFEARIEELSENLPEIENFLIKRGYRMLVQEKTLQQELQELLPIYRAELLRRGRIYSIDG